MVKDARTRTVAVLSSAGVVFAPGARVPLEAEDAARVYDLLVDREGVLAPGPGTTHPDGRPGAGHVLDADLVARRGRGNDARTLSTVVLTSQGVVDGGRLPLEVDEALAVYEVLVEEAGVLVPAPSSYYPGQWRDRGDGFGVAVATG